MVRLLELSNLQSLTLKEIEIHHDGVTQGGFWDVYFRSAGNIAFVPLNALRYYRFDVPRNTNVDVLVLYNPRRINMWRIA